MIRWPSGETVQTRCKVCCAEGTMALCAAAPHIARPENEVLFSQCSTCASISALEDITDFDQIQEGDADVFLRQYVESTAGLWEMFWPPASLQDAATKSFLDVGCGYGFTTDAWKTVLHPHAFGCDPASYASAGRQTLGEHITMRCWTIFRLYWALVSMWCIPAKSLNTFPTLAVLCACWKHV